MILPKLSAAILAMGMLGSAYAASSLERDISLDQWVMMCGAANGAADAAGANPLERQAHRLNVREHLMRYALEQGLTLHEFDALFDQGVIEGKRLLAGGRSIDPGKLQSLMQGFLRDTNIPYQDVRNALSAV
ncbi:hypothetical protein [Pollutimonas sp. M17]|uniref:hypothetical protein n=1 Tax=Pollutimonas sp. M17 TaxID=2962065 RepID=UPI0021F4F541|nr:hypothetical protein [Pollutimonas sp. M17]UYO92991.1 hypothetical protein OEG81_14000 [Pollutimonas sp. M17]HWK72577.1 hypothetical protein [Burkholderiaceae bacterium]